MKLAQHVFNSYFHVVVRFSHFLGKTADAFIVAGRPISCIIVIQSLVMASNANPEAKWGDFMREGRLDLLTSPQEFFHDKITAASTTLRVKLDEHVEFYLVNLLTKYVSYAAPNSEDDSDGSDDPLATPLVFMLKRALDAPMAQRPQLYRALGDSSLYVSGFFQDYFNRKAFDINYYIDMGASAYEQASSLTRALPRDDALHETLESLAKNFAQIVDVVAQASDSSAMQQDSSILNLYDRWNRSGSERIRLLLEDKGIHPIKVPFKQAQ